MKSLQVFGAIAGAYVQWLVLASVGWSGSLEDVGRYVFYLAILTPVGVIASFSLRNMVSSDVNRSYAWGAYLAVNRVGAALVTGAGFILMMARPEDWVLISSITAMKLVDNISESVYGYDYRQLQPAMVAYSKVCRAFAATFFAVIALTATGLKEFTPLLVAIGGFVGFYILEILRRGNRDKERGGKNNQVISIIKSSVPLTLGTLVISLSVSFPRFFVERFHGFEELAVFTYMVYYISLAQIPLTAILAPMVPRLVGLGYNESIRLLVDKYLVGYLFLFSVFVALFSTELTRWIYAAENISYGLVDKGLVIGIFAVQATNIVVNLVLVARKDYATIFKYSLLVLMANIFIGWLLINKVGVTGAYLAVLTSGLIGFIYALYIRKRD